MKTPTSKYPRCGKKWTINECLQLQREYELIGLSVEEIAALHKRSVNSIMFKLDQEGFAAYNTLYEADQMISPCNRPTGNYLVSDQDVLEAKIGYLMAGVEPKLLEEMKQACDRCEQLLKKMRYYLNGSLQTQTKNTLPMYLSLIHI